jgi:hypothetical protein
VADFAKHLKHPEALQPALNHGPYPLLWYASNTPHKISTTRCDWERWFTQHAGPHGTGYRLRATAVPLATGIAHHRGLELIGEWILDWQAAHPGQQLMQLPVEVLAWAAEECAASYEAKARAKGLQTTMLDAQTAPAIEQLILEQRTLIEGMVWIWGLTRLPALLPQYRLFAVEHEDCLVLDCTCGLGESIADIDQHEARSCTGIAYMAKADQLWQKVGSTSYTYLQFKSAGSLNIYKKAQWEHSGQLLFDMESASRRYGIDVAEGFVDYSMKGWRGRDRNAPPTEPKYQHSYLCYAYYDAAIGLQEIQGNLAASWAAEASWYDEVAGKNRKVPQSFVKVPIWEPERPLPVVREGASRVENWVRGVLTDLQRAKLVEVLGPFPRPQLRVPLAIAGIKAEERRFRADVEYLREHGAVYPNHPLVDQVIARSWECTSYDGTRCLAYDTCHREIGWESPEGNPRFERRRPHHDPELRAVLALGHELPEDEDEIGGDDGGE